MSRTLFRSLRRLSSPFRGPKQRPSRKPAPAGLTLEALEDRSLMSHSGLSPLAPALPAAQASHRLLAPDYRLKSGAGVSRPASSAGPVGLTPAQVRHAYGFDQVSFNGISGDGRGQTIAIVDAFDDPTIANDLATFDAAFGLAAPPSFRKVAQNGSGQLPAPNYSWATEIALDVEWAHAVAPQASVLLVEANDNTDTNLFAAVDYAARQPGVAVVSMSFGRGEFSSDTALNSHFLTPAGHAGVTFVAASGDAGVVDYPATSPNVLAVGGTQLTLGTGYSYGGESGWSGSGGGISGVEARPAYQAGVLPNSTLRGNPDVAYDGAPASAFAVCDSFNNGTSTPWYAVYGTSAGAPQWAALVAIADQGRAQLGAGPLDGASQTLPMLYSLPASDLHDVTSGSNAGFSAGAGYDLVTGLGSPVANRLAADLLPTALQAVSPRGTLATINYGTSSQYENIFRVGRDGTLYCDHYDAVTGWHWASQGGPGVSFASSPVVINYGSPGTCENVFLTGTDGNLYCDHYTPAGGWQWVKQGNPGVGLASNLAVINYGSSGQYENVFVIGADGNLYCDHYDPTSGWSWGNQGKPGVGLLASPAVINYANGSVENVFAIGADGALYCDHYTPAGGWQWARQGSPGVRFASNPTVIDYSSNGRYCENVFLTGVDGLLYCNHYDPTSGWSWANQGNSGVSLASNPTAINYANGSVENVFAIGADGALYCDHYTPAGGWQWVKQGNPGVGLASNPTVIDYTNSGGACTENVFVTGSDGNLWVNSFDPNWGWAWLNLGTGGFAGN